MCNLCIVSYRISYDQLPQQKKEKSKRVKVDNITLLIDKKSSTLKCTYYWTVAPNPMRHLENDLGEGADEKTKGTPIGRTCSLSVQVLRKTEAAYN